jgi:hypothetical protein
MKKITTLLACVAFAFSSLIGIAQTDKKTETAKQEAPAKKTEGGQKLKKDGTPDMRYKENKEAAKPAAHTKKDGTPDKRYKENKPK